MKVRMQHVSDDVYEPRCVLGSATLHIPPFHIYIYIYIQHMTICDNIEFPVQLPREGSLHLSININTTESISIARYTISNDFHVEGEEILLCHQILLCQCS